MDSVAAPPGYGTTSDLDGWKFNGRRFKKLLGVLPFTPGAVNRTEKSNQYETVGGPSFHSKSSVVYGNTVVNLGKAMNRLDAARPNEDALRLANLNIAPKKGRRLARYLDSYYRKVRAHLTPDLFSLRDALTEQIECALDPTHPKYAVRLRAIRELIRGVNVFDSLFTLGITVKLKIPETAKYGKDGRVIGDFSCPGSLLAPFLVGPLKHAFGHRIEYDGCTIVFCESTEPTHVDTIIEEMCDSPHNYFVYFSDDMCCKIFEPDGPKLYNLDISACDRSNTRPVFERLRWFYNGTGWDELIDKAIRQCELPVTILNPEDRNGRLHRTERITAQTKNPKEFSGTILTTVLNNIASAAICLSIHHSLSSGHWTGTGGDIARCAAAVGYIVTAQECRSEADLQFLKLSFWRDSAGRLHSFLNLGAIIRNFGSTWKDYPYDGRKETLDDAIRFRNWAVLQGYRHAGDNPLLEALRCSPGCQRPTNLSIATTRVIMNSVAVSNRYKSSQSAVKRQPVPSRILMNRYNLTDQEWEELCSFTREADVGDIIFAPAVSKILHCDYGYPLE